MKNKIILPLAAVILGSSALFAVAQDNNQPNDGPPPGAPAQRGPGVAGQRPAPGFHLLPPRAQDQLNLTDDQKKQIAALEADTKAKLEKILTKEQLDQLKNFRPPMGPGGPQMRGGQGRGPGGGDGNMPPNGPPPGDGNNPPPGGPPGEN